MLKHLLYVMRIEEKPIQIRIALALAHLCSPEDQRTIFIDNNGTYNYAMYIYDIYWTVHHSAKLSD